jgi:hypothetical protein
MHAGLDAENALQANARLLWAVSPSPSGGPTGFVFANMPASSSVGKAKRCRHLLFLLHRCPHQVDIAEIQQDIMDPGKPDIINPEGTEECPLDPKRKVLLLAKRAL